ncbi:hypothetical protein V6N13_081117 [Hibiscus sabdariffa]
MGEQEEQQPPQVGENRWRVWTLFVNNISDRLHWQGVGHVFDRQEKGSTVEPKLFKCAIFLIEMTKLERIEEMVEVIVGDNSLFCIHVQEVEVVHSHDIICPYDKESNDSLSEDDPSNDHEDYVTRVNPLFMETWGTGWVGG